ASWQPGKNWNRCATLIGGVILFIEPELRRQWYGRTSSNLVIFLSRPVAMPADPRPLTRLPYQWAAPVTIRRGQIPVISGKPGISSILDGCSYCPTRNLATVRSQHIPVCFETGIHWRDDAKFPIFVTGGNRSSCAGMLIHAGDLWRSLAV